MKTFTILFISLFGITSFTNTTKAQVSFSADISFNSFYNQLSPYGQWMELPRYGRVWRYAEPGFRPYATNGQWQYTDAGWYWNSGYEWGSIPFHYGRWELDPYYGWIWIPGYDYAPAWVAWSQADDCYGWAPLGYGVGIDVSCGSIPSNRWMYASAGNIMRPGIDRYCMPYRRNDYYFRRQQPVININIQRNVRYAAGPAWNDHFGDSRNNRFGQQRPPVRDNNWDRYNNNRYNGNGYNNNQPRRNDYSNNERRPDNNIHFDPSQYNRERAIAGQRPQINQDTRGREQSMRPEINRMRPEINSMESRPQPQTAPSRAFEQTRQQPQAAPSRTFEQPRSQPQRNEGARPFGARDRRIF